MAFFHIILALLVVAIWGVNYIFIQFGLLDIPPLLLAALRFLLTCFPAIFFIKRPSISFPLLASYGFVLFGMKFSLLFVAMKLGASAGLASILLQLHVFFTLLFANIFLGEKIERYKIIGALIAFFGVAIVGINLGGSMTLLGLILLIGSAISFGMGNVITKKIGKVNTLSLLSWGSLFAWPPLLLLSFCLEGFENAFLCVQKISSLSFVSLLYIVGLSTFLGFGLWSWLLQKYPISLVAPFTLLVPVFGLLSSIIFLGESLDFWKLEAALCVVCGLFVNFLPLKKEEIKEII